MNNKIFLTIVLTSLLLACTEDKELIPNNTPPVVSQNATYEVLVTEDLIYGEGLSHESLNSPTATTLPLYMDSYVPDNNSQNRPLLVLIHGGGFSGGTKQQEPLVDMANYYAARGFVVFSIDYRLRGNKGTIPQEWIDASSDIPAESIGQFYAIYPAHRDAKAALRWIVANAENYNINTDYITVGGGSAGATTSIGVGVSDLADYKEEITSSQDPTLTSTNYNQAYTVKTILDFWGSDSSIETLELIYGYQRFDQNIPSIFIAHGTEDTTVPYSNAEDLKAIYQANNADFVFYALEGRGHGAWGTTIDGESLSDLSFAYVLEVQNLIAE